MDIDRKISDGLRNKFKMVININTFIINIRTKFGEVYELFVCGLVGWMFHKYKEF